MALWQFPNIPLFFFFFIFMSFLSITWSVSAHNTSLPSPVSIYDILRSNGLPPGILPKPIRSFTLHSSGALEVLLDRPCLTKFDSRVFFDDVITGNLSYGALTDVSGLTQEELFLWLPIKDIFIDDPSSGLILIDMGVAYKQLSLSLFDSPPDCKPEEDDNGVLLSELGLKNGRREERLETQR